MSTWWAMCVLVIQGVAIRGWNGCCKSHLPIALMSFSDAASFLAALSMVYQGVLFIACLSLDYQTICGALFTVLSFNMGVFPFSQLQCSKTISSASIDFKVGQCSRLCPFYNMEKFVEWLFNCRMFFLSLFRRFYALLQWPISISWRSFVVQDDN